MIKQIKIRDLISDKFSGEWGQPSTEEKSVKVLRTTNFTNSGDIDYSEVVERLISDKKVIEKRLIYGDVIIEKSGGSLNQPVGRVVFFDRTDNETFLCNNFTTILRSSEIIYPKFLFYSLFNNHYIKKTLKYQNKTTGIINLQLERYLNEKIFLPPFPDQKRIVEILDKAEALREKRKQTIKLLDEFLRSTFLDMFGDPAFNKDRWKQLTLPQFISKNKYAIKRGPFGGSLKKEIFVKDGYLVYEQTHAIHNDFSFARYYITEEKYKELEMFKVVPGDLIISCSGVTLGRIAEIPPNAKPGIINQALLKITLDNQKVNNTYFIFLFKNRRFQDILFGVSRGSGIPNFPPISTIKNIKFPIPQIELQNKFAKIVEQVEETKAKMEQSLDEMDNLFNSLMQRAFKGEL